MGERQECRGVLVSGGAGFIGSHLVDDLSSGKLANVAGHLRCGVIDFFEGDIRDFLVTRRCVRGVDVVVHLAAVGEVFNVGGGRPTSINDSISCISRLTGADLKVSYQPARPGDIRRIYADVYKAR